MSPLGLVIAGFLWLNWKEVYYEYIFYMTSWKRNVDGTIACVKADTIEHSTSIINSYHENISFTYEQEINKKNLVP